MKSIRILFACVLASFASVALVRAEGEVKTEKKADAACCSMEKKAETKAEKKGCCCAEGCAKPEKKDEKKS
jgi:hypothetical protein